MGVRVSDVVRIPVFICFGVTLAGQGPDVSTRALVKSAATYVAEYQKALTRIVADELYAQNLVEQRPSAADAPRARSMRSEVFFLFAPGGADWMAIRDVLSIDGRPVAERTGVREALRTLPARDVAVKAKEYNSRFNIGRTYRNFNEPTLALLVLDDNHRRRFSFDRERIEKIGGVTVATLSFRERDTPTLIFDLKRGRVFSRGEIVVEAETGRVRRTSLRAAIGPIRFEFSTTYAPDERLGIWVPSVFREVYEYGNRSSARSLDAASEYEHLVCEASYSNFRRFETDARVK